MYLPSTDRSNPNTSWDRQRIIIPCGPYVGSYISIENLDASENIRRSNRYRCWRDGEVVGNGEGMGGGKQKSDLSPHIRKDNVLAYTLIFALAIVRNGLPRMIGI